MLCNIAETSEVASEGIMSWLIKLGGTIICIMFSDNFTTLILNLQCKP